MIRASEAVLRDADDAVGSLHVGANERHVVAADLGLGQLRVLQEEEVVERDDVLRLPAGDDERMRRMNEVEGDAHQAVEGREAEAVPGEMKELPRHAPVHHRDVGRPRRRGVPLLERGREVDEPVGGGEGREPARQREDVRPDARGPRERRA